MSIASIYIGNAGWNIPADQKSNFPEEGTHLERYASSLPCVEINSSFYKTHLDKTYIRWRESVPKNFRFSVKFPKTITHQHRLKDVDNLLDDFLKGIIGLREKLGCLLIQLPPSFAFNEKVAVSFLNALRHRYHGPLVLEARHKTWFTEDVEKIMVNYKVAQVAADPAVCVLDEAPRGWQELIYYRWHGTPDIYKSRYSVEQIDALAQKVNEHVKNNKTVWCIFDNTTYGASYDNAFELISALNIKL